MSRNSSHSKIIKTPSTPRIVVTLTDPYVLKPETRARIHQGYAEFLDWLQQQLSQQAQVWRETKTPLAERKLSYQVGFPRHPSLPIYWGTGSLTDKIGTVSQGGVPYVTLVLGPLNPVTRLNEPQELPGGVGVLKALSAKLGPKYDVRYKTGDGALTISISELQMSQRQPPLVQPQMMHQRQSSYVPNGSYTVPLGMLIRQPEVA